jgi:hypothetical protein
MRYRKDLLIASVAALVTAAIPASGQTVAADPARKALTDAANALGMVRGVNHALDVVNMFEYVASGTMADPKGGENKVSRITVGYDYVIPAARVDVEKTTPDGRTERDIAVAVGRLSWDESKPGIYLRPANTSAAERLKQMWLLPHAVILEGAKAPDKVKVADRGGMKELIVAMADGTELKALLDAKNLTTRVEYRAGAQVLSGDYSDYKDFREYGVMFPSRIVQKIDGRTVADFTVSDALPNPYLIFPLPRELAQKPSP